MKICEACGSRIKVGTATLRFGKRVEKIDLCWICDENLYKMVKLYLARRYKVIR